jgi:hypothetical protein
VMNVFRIEVSSRFPEDGFGLTVSGARFIQ